MPTPIPRADDGEAESFTAWPLIAAIGFAKLATFGVIIVMSLDRESLALIAATSGPWLAIGFALLSAPVIFHIRLRRARRRRLALQRAEWMVGPTTDLPAVATAPAVRRLRRVRP